VPRVVAHPRRRRNWPMFERLQQILEGFGDDVRVKGRAT